MKIDGFISELLFEHDCVIVSELGGFIAHYHPATINSSLNVISPPSKRLAFNASLKNNDGLLAHHISHRETLSYADACKVIADFVKQAKNQMHEGKKLKIEKVGVLFIDKNKNLQFLPDQHTNYLIESFGLSPVHAPVINKDNRTQNAPVVNKFEEEEEEREEVYSYAAAERPGRIYKWKVLEVIPAAAVLAFLLMVPPVLENFNANLSTLLPFSRINEYMDELKGKEPYYHQPATIEYKNPFLVPPANLNEANAGSENIEASAEAPTSGEVTVTASEVINTDPVTTTPPPAETIEPEKTPDYESGNISTTYHIIGGSFRSKENADNFVADMRTAKNLDAQIIGQNKSGLFMVSLFSSDNYIQVTDALPGMKADAVSGAWVYKK